MKERGLTPTALGNKLGKPNAYNAVNSWTTTNAKNSRGLGYEDTIAMLELCGWLNMTGDVTANDSTPADPLAALATAVAAVERGQAEILRLLRAEKEARTSRPRAAPKVKQ